MTDSSSDLAYRVMRLEQQLDSYERLHAEELDAIRRAIEELKEHLLKSTKPLGGNGKASRSPD